VVVDRIVTANLPGHTAPALVWFVALLVSSGFVGMFVLQAALASPRGTARLNQWHIHASNGFYVESTLRRVCGSLIKREKRETASKAMPTA
jgi:cytochrome b561